MWAARSTLLKTLFNVERMAFASSSKKVDVQKTINKAVAKVRLKQSVTDIKKLQGYLEKAKSDKNLDIALSRTAKYDQEFNDFLKQYKEKNKEFVNIIDLSQYSLDQNNSKTQQMREEEIIMLEEFRRRKQDKTLYLESDDESGYEQKNKDKKAEESDEEVEGELPKMIDPTRFNKASLAEDTKNWSEKVLEDRLQKLYGGQEFVLCVLDRGVTTLVTTLNRVNHFRYLVFMGNGNGVIGYGTGKGANFEIALVKAIKNCKKNLVALPLDHFKSWTLPAKVHSNGMTLTLNPRSEMNAWGNPIMGTLLMLSGVSQVSFSIYARNPNNYNLVYCLFKALTTAKTPKDLAETMGHKIYHNNFGSLKYSADPKRIPS